MVVGEKIGDAGETPDPVFSPAAGQTAYGLKKERKNCGLKKERKKKKRETKRKKENKKREKTSSRGIYESRSAFSSGGQRCRM